MKPENTTLNNIILKFDENGWDYEVVRGELWDEVHLSGTGGSNYIVRCNKRNKLVRVHLWLDFDEGLVVLKRNRLLQACDITNREMFLKARLFKDGIDIIYEIPESAASVVGDIVCDVLYSFNKYIDPELFKLAVTSDADLYDYYESREGELHERIVSRIEKEKAQRSSRPDMKLEMWRHIQKYARDRVCTLSYDVWIDKLEIDYIDEGAGIVYLTWPDQPQLVSHINEHYLDILEEAANCFDANDYRVVITAAGE